MRRIDRIIVHHTATSPGASWESIREMHRARGWYTWGYHHGIAADGRHLLGRPVDRVGAHDQGENATSIGVVLIGSFTSWNDVPDVQKNKLLTLLSDLCHHYNLTADQVFGHRENEPASTPTVCPGFDPEDMRRALRETPPWPS